MQKKKNKKKNMTSIKFIIIIAVVIVVVGFLVYPFIKFGDNKNKMIDGAEHYMQINRNKLPQRGEVRTLTLSELYQQQYVDTLYIPYSSNLCSVKDSWVKVTNVDGNYKYHAYLKCGVYSSMVDHKGPSIILNGEENITLNKGEKFSDPGVKSVSDNEDGKIDTNQVKIKNNVNTSKVGKYTITYTVSDSLQNETVVKRNVTVVQKLNDTVKEATDNTGVYKGNVNNNYIMFSGIVFRIVKVNDDDTIRIVADKNISYVDYKNVNDWLNDYFYNHLTDKSKKYIAKGKFCDDTTKSYNVKSCKKYKEANVGLLSLDNYNNSIDGNSSYLLNRSITWTSNKSSSKNAWTAMKSFEPNVYYKSYSQNDSNAIRPVINLVKETEIKSGNGTENNPYKIGDYKKAKKSTKVNKLVTGEYIYYLGYSWRFIEKTSNGNSKIIMDNILMDNGLPVQISYEKNTNRVYNPKENGNLGYKINQGLGDYIKSNSFEEYNISVPIYKNKALYKGEDDKKEYKVRLASPSMRELFSGKNEGYCYWYRDSSKNKDRVYVVSETGSVYNDINEYIAFNCGVKLVAELNKQAIVANGSGTQSDPYTINN